MIRLTMYLVVIGILLCSASLLIVTRSWFIVWLVRPELEKRLGGPVLIEKASYQGDGGFVFQNIALDAPNIVGPAKNLVEIERVEVRLDPEALFDGEVVLTYVEISGLHLRLSENRNQAGEMNFMSLTPMWDSQATMLPPTVQINDVTIQVGMHDGVSFQNMGHRVFSGSMHPLEDHPSWFGFTLDEFDAETGTTGTGNLRINGQWDASTLAFTSDVSGLELSPETHSMCPSLVRFWWEQMDLEGSVHRMQVTYEPGQQMEIEMDLLDVALSLPIDTEGMWSVYHNGKAHLSDESPRMHVDRGVVELALDRLVLRNLEGTIGERIVDGVQVGLPFEGSFRIASLPDFDWANRDQWLDQVLNEAPFELEFRIVDFKVFPDEDGETREVKLPTSIAKLFERFNMTQWELDSRFVLQRGTFDDGSNPPDSIELRTEGDIFLSHARGAFGPFPYPLHDVKAHVMINNDEARILELTALGEGDSVVELTGRIAPLSRNPSVKIDLVARNLTTSDILRQALNEKQRAIYDAFFHDASHEALLRSGALDDATQFEYGGMLDLTLHFDRPPGPDQSLVITGEADIDRIGVIHDNFPYPVTVEGGRITIEEDRIALHGLDDDPGLSILMAGGGQGFVSGEIRFLRTDGKLEVRPELRLAVQGDTFSQLLYTSIPMASSERALLEDQSDWPGQALSRTSRLLKGMGPTGLLNYEGDLYLDEHGRFDYEFMVHLAGSATPGEALADAIGTAGLIWPEGFSLDHVEGDLRVTRDRIELKQLTGQQDRTRVSASGSIDLREGINDTTIHVTFEQLELGPYLINLAPSESADQVREFWNRYQPHGHFGLDLEYRVTDDEDVLTLEVMPENIGFTLDGQPVRLMHEGGDILLMDKIVQFNELGLRLFSNDRNDGSILLNGAYSSNEIGNDLSVKGLWQEGRLESPLVLEVLHLVGAESQIKQYRTLAPSGRFDSSFQYVSPRGGQPADYWIDIDPKTIDATINDRDMHAQMGEDSRISFLPGVILVRDVIGNLNEGFFHIAGDITLDDRIEIDMSIEYDGRLRTDDVEAMLPLQIREWADAVSFTDDAGSSLRGGRLYMREIDTSDGPGWSVDFSGRFTTDNASIDLGADLSQIDGAYRVSLNHTPGQWPDLEIDANIDRMLINEREITNLIADAYLDKTSETMHVQKIVSHSHGGKIVGNARFGLGDDSTYDFKLDLVGVALDGILKPHPTDPSSESESDTSDLHGEVFGTIRIHGQRGQPETRIGRGMVRAFGKRVATMPLMLHLMRVIQGILPFGGELNYAEAPFVIQGDQLIFEEVVIENSIGDASPVQIFGYGSMELNSFELDMDFQVRSWNPILSKILQPIGDQILGIRVVGPLNEPEIKLVPLPGLSRDNSSPRKSEADLQVATGSDATMETHDR